MNRFIVYQGDKPYLESPEERGLADGPPLLRVFEDKCGAEWYREIVRVYAGSVLIVKSVKPGETIAQGLDGVKVDLCYMEGEDQWPVSIQTIWQPGQMIH